MAIARALANDPDVVLADEPTANLDSVSGREVAEVLQRLATEEDKAVIVVSHDQRLLEIASRRLDRGRAPDRARRHEGPGRPARFRARNQSTVLRRAAERRRPREHGNAAHGMRRVARDRADERVA